VNGWIPRFSVHRPVTVLTLFSVVLVVGFIAWFRIPVQMMPAGWVSTRLWLWVSYDDSTPLETEARIVRPLEEQISTVGGIKHLEADAESDGASLSLEFHGDVDMDEAYNAVGDRVERAMAELPDDVERVWIWRFDPSDEPVIWAGVSAPPGMSDEDMHFLTSRVIQKRLERVPGIGRVDVWGVPEPVVWIDFDRDRLMAHGVDLMSVIGRLGGDNVQLGAGRVHDRGEVRYVRSLARYGSLDDLRRWPIGDGLVLTDIAEVRYAPAASADISRIEGNEAAAVAINKESSANTLEVCEATRAVFAELEADPRLEGWKFHTFFDQGLLIERSLRSLYKAAVEGGVLAVVVLAFFLREWRVTTLIASTIPSSLLLTVTVMYFAGGSLNLLSMLGLMIAVGIAIDNAVVVVEAILRRRQLGQEPVTAAIDGTSEVLLPVVLCTLTSSIVFLPVILMSGDADFSFFLGALGLPVVYVHVASLLITLLFTPLSTVWLSSAIIAPDGRWLVALSARVTGLLQRVLRNPVDSFVGVLAMVVLTLLLPAQGVSCEDGADGNIDDFAIRFEVPSRFTYAERLATVEAFEAVAVENRERWGVRTWRSRLGSDSNRGRLYVYLEEDDGAGMSRDEVLADAAKRLPDLPGVTATVGHGDGEGSEQRRISLSVVGEDSETLAALAAEVGRRLRSIPGVLSVADEVHGGGQEEIVLRVQRDAAARYGVSASNIGRLVSFAMRGAPLSPWVVGERDVRIFTRFGEADREDVDRLLDFEIGSRTGGVALRGLVDPEPGKGWGSISRRDRKTELGLTVELDDDAERGAVYEAAMAALADMDWPEGYGPERGDEWLEQQESDRAQNSALLLSVVFVFLVMGVLFESFLLPLTVIVTVPMAAFGVYWGLWLTDTSFGPMGGIGMVVLIGIVVNNGIVLVARVTELRHEGLDRETALVEAVRQRLRPILMTAVTAIVGILPMAVGNETFVGIPYAPLGRVVAFGMGAATLLTLFFVPWVYTQLDDLRLAGARWLAFAWPTRPLSPEVR
jgi:HAE1 family hydrophobic/amphiphilic exporter-1